MASDTVFPEWDEFMLVSKETIEEGIQDAIDAGGVADVLVVLLKDEHYYKEMDVAIRIVGDKFVPHGTVYVTSMAHLKEMEQNALNNIITGFKNRGD